MILLIPLASIHKNAATIKGYKGYANMPFYRDSSGIFIY